MPRILCLGTATHLCSVAVCDGVRVLASRDEEDRTRYTHAEHLHGFVEAVMREAGLAMRHLDAVAVDVGPGSYTGLRIGVSAAKGYCYALGIPIIGIGTLEILAAAVSRAAAAIGPGGDDVLHPMVDARRMEVFAGDPPHGVVLSGEWVAGLDPSKRHFVFGDGADKATELWMGQPHVIHVPGIRPLASAMVAVAQQRFDAARFDDLAYLVPIYGKEPNVTPPRK